MRVEAQIEIAQPPGVVWDFVVDRSNDAEWCRKVKSVERIESGGWKIWHKPVPLRPAALLETKHLHEDPPTSLAIREEDDTSIFEVEYTLEQTPTGTLFTQVSEFEFKTLPGPLHRIFAFGVKRDVAGQLKELKRQLERG